MLEQDTTTSVYRILHKLFSAPSPTLSITSFQFIGTLGSTSAQPRVISSNTNTNTLNWTLYQSASNTDASYSVLTSGSVASPASSVTLTHSGSTIANRYYYYSLTAVGPGGSVTVTTSHLQNVLPAPTISVTSFAFAGTVGSTFAQPSVVVADTNATSLSWSLYQSASNTDASYSIISTGTVGSPTGSDTITYGGTTTADRWYYYAVTATNATGSATATTTHLQNYNPPPPPTLTYISEGFNYGGTTTPGPFIIVEVDGYQPTVTWEFWMVGPKGGADQRIAGPSNVIGYPSGQINITYYGTCDIDEFFYWKVTATNIYGSATPIDPSPQMQNTMPA